jgi:hypothetical protein
LRKVHVTLNGYGMAALLAACFGLSGMGIVMNRAAIKESDRQFCAIIDQSVQRAQRQESSYRLAPPTTEAGKRQRGELMIALYQLQVLQRDLGCPPDEGILK